MIEGTYLTFYENGNLESKHIYFKGLPEGKYEWYHEEGKLKQIGWYERGKKERLDKFFYSDGKTSSISNWTQDTKISNYIEYFPDGCLKRYFYFDPHGTLLFAQEFDNKGTVVEEHGSRITIQNIIKNDFDQTLKIQLLLAIPPQNSYSTLLSFKIIALDKKLVLKDEKIKVTSDKIDITEDFSVYPIGKYQYSLELIVSEKSKQRKYHKKLLIVYDGKIDYFFPY